MTKQQTNMRLSEETRAKLDQIAIVQRQTTGQETSNTQIVTDLIDSAYAQLKRITPIRDGKRTIGWAAYYGEHFVTQVDGAGSKDKAQYALDAFVREELSK